VLGCVAGERRTKGDKDAGNANSRAIRATEDTVPRRSAAARRVPRCRQAAESRAGDKGRSPRTDPRSPAVNSDYWMWTPEIAREMTRRWISEVPSKMV
jgi:hypothetical protein